MLLNIEQEEFVFKSAVEAAADLARDGSSPGLVVGAAEAVVAAAIAAQKKLDAENE
jgi:hypothetical protein